MKRTCENGSLRASDAGKTVTLIGWVAKRRNLGSLVFIDLRDRSGIVQITFDETMAEKVKEVRSEYILSVTGTVVLRKDANPKLATGEIEVLAQDVTIVNRAETSPITIADDTDTNEDTRLKYRYLDLRRPVLQKIMILRHKVCMIEDVCSTRRALSKSKRRFWPEARPKAPETTSCLPAFTTAASGRFPNRRRSTSSC